MNAEVVRISRARSPARVRCTSLRIRFYLRMLQAVRIAGGPMSERPLARGVVARQRFARLFELGDRRNPSSWAPALVLTKNDPDLPLELAPFISSRDYSEFPAKISMTTRGDICIPFNGPETWSGEEGLILPASLVDSDSGISPVGNQMLPVSWQSLHHDSSLLNSEIEPSVVVLIDAPQLAERPGKLIEAVDAIRIRFPTSLIWAPGISGPDNCALLSWMGIDLFDLSRSQEAVTRNVLLTEDGPREVEKTTGESANLQTQIDAWTRALSATRSAIRDGTLRELVERQALSSPRSVERLRRYDSMMSERASENPGLAGLASNVELGRRLRCHSHTSRNDPLISEWKRRVTHEHTPPSHQSEVLVLLPCSAQKPYRLSQSHRRFQRVISTRGVHEVMVTAPLGLVPRELEDIWPAAHYDIPVTGDWDLDELKTIKDMVSTYSTRNGYQRIINHSGIQLEVTGIDIVDTRMGASAGSSEALSRLESEINKASLDFKLSNPKESVHRLSKLKALSRFKHGTDLWLDGAKVSGRPPIFRIGRDGTQIAMWNPHHGRFSFSKACLASLDVCNALSRAHLTPETNWRGDVFSTNLSQVEGDICIGDEILVYQNNNLIGSARATAAGWEWPDGPGRLAKAQHRL